MDNYEPCSCLDLTALQDHDGGDEAERAESAQHRDYTQLLLVVSSRGVEFVKVPKVTH
jgi:hypothetical protein